MSVNPLVEAIINADIRKIILLVNQGVDINEKYGEEGLTPLIEAITEGNVDIVRTLIEFGANIELPPRYGETPLKTAISTNNYNIVSLLVEKGADVNNTNVGEKYAEVNDMSYTESPLLAAIMDSEDINIIRLLLEKGANPNVGWVFNSEGIIRSDFTNHAEAPLFKAVQLRTTEVVKLLLEAGADPNIGRGALMTPLTLAVRDRKLEVINLLLNTGADVNIVDPHGTPLIAAIKNINNDIQLVTELLNRGANPNMPDYKATPLIYAINVNSVEFVNLLLDYGADPNLKVLSEPYPIVKASLGNNLEIMYVLILRGANRNRLQEGINDLLLRAVKARYYNLVQLLLQEGIEIDNITDLQGRSLIDIANMNPDKRIYNLLISRQESECMEMCNRFKRQRIN